MVSPPSTGFSFTSTRSGTNRYPAPETMSIPQKTNPPGNKTFAAEEADRTERTDKVAVSQPSLPMVRRSSFFRFSVKVRGVVHVVPSADLITAPAGIAVQTML